MKTTKTIAILGIILLLIAQVTFVYAADVPEGEFDANLTVEIWRERQMRSSWRERT